MQIYEPSIEARKTFDAIKRARKIMPTRTRAERDALDAEIKKAHAEWWDKCKNYFASRRAELDKEAAEHCKQAIVERECKSTNR